MLYRLSALLVLCVIAMPVTVFAQSDPVTLPTAAKPTSDSTIAPVVQASPVEKAPDVYKAADPEIEKALQALRNLPPQPAVKAAPTPAIAMPDLNTKRASPTIGGAFSLINQNGARVTDANFRNAYMLVMFGYTRCGADCPPVIGNVMQALHTLPQAQASRIMPVFVTLDPARDNPAALKNYLGDYNRRVIGLTGTPAEIDRMAKLYSVNYRIAKNPDVVIERSLSPQDFAALRREPGYRQQSGESYTIDASPFVYLIGPDGQLATLFNGELPPETIAKNLASAFK